MAGPVPAGTAGLNATLEPQHLAEPGAPTLLCFRGNRLCVILREFNKRLLVFLGGGMPTRLGGFTKIN